MQTQEHQPRYVACATAHGKTPDDMMAHDTEEYPGGKMCGFICWMSEQMQAFRKAPPRAFLGDHIADQDAWTKFLQTVAKSQ